MTVLVRGVECRIRYASGEARCLVEWEGAFTFVDRDETGTWDLSGQPASPDEIVVLNDCLAGQFNKTVVTATPPEEP
jgi:hypothetical protein